MNNQLTISQNELMPEQDTTLGQSRWYSRWGLWTLFLMAALPIHLWTIILVFNDFSWLAERTNAWDAVGVGAYGMIYAFLESIVIFLILVVLGFLLPKRWLETKRISLISVLFLITALWAILGQLYFLINFQLPEPVFWFLVNSGHPLRIIYPTVLLLAGITAIIPTIWIMRSKNATRIAIDIIERLKILSMLYIFFDVIALGVILIRNIG